MAAESISPTEYGKAFEQRRHSLRQGLLGPTTIRHLESIGIQPDWQCLEIGAGQGSITRWLASKVGESGRVVATELDTQYLDSLDEPNVEVRQHNILFDPLETDAFDLVHCRTVLMHLSHPDLALHRLVAAVRPGGRLLIEDGDFGSFGAAKLEHPAAADFNRISRTITDGWQSAGIMHSYLGRRLPGLVAASGLQETQHEGTTRIRRGGDPGAQFLRMGFTELLREPLIAAGHLTTHDLQQINGLFEDPTFEFIDYTIFSVWGQKLPIDVATK